MISQELMDEIIYISLKQQIISKEFIEKIVNYIISKCDQTTKDLFNGLYFEKTEWDFAIAALNPDGRIVANYDEIISLCEDSTHMSFLQKNLYILHYIFHEIEHLKEDSKLNRNDYESTILRYGSGRYVYNRYYNIIRKKFNAENFIEKLTNKKYKLFYEKNWDIIPSERIAEVGSRKIILDSFKNYPDYELKFFDEYKWLTNLYVNTLMIGYKKLENGRYNIPILEYFDNLGKLQDSINIGYSLKNKRFLKEIGMFDTELKMKYGFPIKPIDIIEINKLKIKGRR